MADHPDPQPHASAGPGQTGQGALNADPSWRRGWEDAGRDPAAQNPFPRSDPAFRAWLQGFFARLKAGDAPAAPPLDAAPAQAPEQAPAQAPAAAPEPDAPPERVRPAPMITLESPGFAVRYPEIINPELINWGSRMAMEESWRRDHIPERPLEFFRLEGAFVTHEGLVFDRDRRVVEQTTFAFTEEEIAEQRRSLDAALEAGRVGWFDGPAMLCKKRAPQNYGHFLVEMLPRAYIAQKLFSSRRLDYIIHRVHAPMLEVASRALYRYGIGLDQTIITSNFPTRYGELLFLDGISEHGRYMSPLAVGALEALALTVEPGPRRKLFVTRPTVNARSMRNEAEVKARLEAAGFEPIDPGALTLYEQIAAFRGAECVVGTMGAAMTNIVFCQPDTRIAMIAPASFPDTFFWFIAQIKKLPYLEIRCDEEPTDDVHTWNAGFTMRAKDIDFLAAF
jgi:hypothetical protein